MGIDDILEIAQAAHTWTRSIRDTGSSPRTPSSPSACEDAGITFIGPRPGRAARCSATRSRRRARSPSKGGRLGRSRASPWTCSKTTPTCPRRRRSSTQNATGDRQSRPRRRRPRHACRAPASTSCATRSTRRARRRRRPSAVRHGVPREVPAPASGTSRSRSSATSRGTSCTCTSATARCSGATRRSSRSRRRPTSARSCGSACTMTRSRSRRSVRYHNAGTVEFLVAGEDSYFIEVNPRLQVEHTVTGAVVTGVDLVQAQILIAQGQSMGSEEIGIFGQSEHCAAVATRSSAASPPRTRPTASCRTRADCWRYRSAGGFGIRLDTGNGYPGALISPHYDSLAGQGHRPRVSRSSSAIHEGPARAARVPHPRRQDQHARSSRTC